MPLSLPPLEAAAPPPVVFCCTAVPPVVLLEDPVVDSAARTGAEPSSNAKDTAARMRGVFIVGLLAIVLPPHGEWSICNRVPSREQPEADGAIPGIPTWYAVSTIVVDPSSWLPAMGSVSNDVVSNDVVSNDIEGLYFASQLLLTFKIREI
jgi:hypothetical protein